MTPLGVKTCGESDFFNAKKRFADPGKACVFKQKVAKNAIFATFRFNTQAFPKSGKRVFASKMSNSNFPYVFTPRGVICRKIFHVDGPLIV
jgi:hypothetical protein